jgi:chondroitin sulfate synthase
MLQYMHAHYHNKFRFFMRADDDIYIQGDVLGRFLHSINSTGRALFIGQVGNRKNFIEHNNLSITCVQ